MAERNPCAACIVDSRPVRGRDGGGKNMGLLVTAVLVVPAAAGTAAVESGAARNPVFLPVPV